MAIERPITITTAPAGSSPRITFTPNPLQANQADQIFWTNNDTQAHWPGLQKTGSVDQEFFMSYQIAPGGGTSTVFSTTVVGTLTYVCTIAGHEHETGRIEITKPPAS